MKKYTYIYLLAVILIIAACKQDKLQPINKDSAPQAITNVQVENLAGAAKISYSLPNDPQLLYVKAVYDLNGEQMEAKASYYTNSLIVDGFGDSTAHQVSLYAVSRGEHESAPVEVEVKPHTPPIYQAYNSLDVIPSFGGMNVKFTNPAEGDLVIGVLLWDDAVKGWRQIDTHYTALASGSFSVRGLDPVEQKFGFFIKDRWSNYTDTLVKVLTPIYEVELDKSKFSDERKKWPVPQMLPLPASGNPMVEAVDYSGSYPEKNLWDGRYDKMFHTKQNYDQPVWIPIDLGVKAKLSRYKIWQRPGGYLYNHGNPHEWELWGTNTPQDPNSWVKLDHRIMVKPSGLPLGQVSNEDADIANAGQEYEVPLDAPAVRYIGWKNIDCWSAIQGATGFFHLEEITFWGQEQ